MVVMRGEVILGWGVDCIHFSFAFNFALLGCNVLFPSKLRSLFQMSTALGSLLWMLYSSVRAVKRSVLNILQKRNTEACSSASEKIKIWDIISEETTRRQKYELRGQLTFVFTPTHINHAYLIYVRGLIMCAQRHT